MPRTRPVLVWDSGPLIALAAAAEVFPRILRLPAEFVLPEAVHREVVVEGLRRGAPEASIVERSIREGPLSVRAPQAGGRALLARLRENPRLSEADATALALAAEIGGRLVADERDLRKAVRISGVEVGGSLYLLLWAVEEGVLTAEEASGAVDRMLERGWYCSSTVLKAFLDTLGPRGKG